MREIRFLISEEDFAFAERIAEEDLFYSAEDYLFALLNTALLRERDEQDWPRGTNEHEADGMLLKAEPAEFTDFDDLDDGIPF